MTRRRPPSPSTRASTSTLIVLRVMTFAFLLEGLGCCVERAVDPLQRGGIQAPVGQSRTQRLRIWGLLRPEAAVAAAVVGRADRAAAGMGHRPQARRRAA